MITTEVITEQVMKTKKSAEKEYYRVYYLVKCPHCGTELVVPIDELDKKLYMPKEVEQEYYEFSLEDDSYLTPIKKMAELTVSSDPGRDIFEGIKCCYCGHEWNETVHDFYEKYKACDQNGSTCRTLRLTEEETKRAKIFVAKHSHRDEFMAQNKLGFSTLGQQFTYHITPGGLGNLVSIECDYCHETEDITDTDNW